MTTPSDGHDRNPPDWRRSRRRLRVGVLLSATVVLGGSGLAQGVETGPPDIRVRGSAMGIGAHFVFSRPGSAPLEPIFDVSFGTAGGGHDQLSNQNHGFAASFYPGATPSTPGSVIGLVGFPIGGQILPPEHPIYQGYSSIPGLIPPWPLVTQGSYPGDPGRRVDLLRDVTGTIPAPLPTDIEGMTQETVVDEDVVTATTNIERLTLTSLGALNPELEPLIAQLEAATKSFTGGGPGVRGNSFTLRGLSARYESVNTGQAAHSASEVAVRDVELFGGLLQFFRVRSVAEYTGGPDGAKLDTHTAEVGLAKVLGLEVTFDHRGVKLTDQRIPASQGTAVTSLLGEILGRAGFTVETTTAEVDGNHVDEVALRIVMAEQEPQLPGAAFLGRKTTVTFEIAALESDFITLPGIAEPGGGSGLQPEDDGGAVAEVSLPGPGLATASARATGGSTASEPEPRAGVPLANRPGPVASGPSLDRFGRSTTGTAGTTGDLAALAPGAEARPSELVAAPGAVAIPANRTSPAAAGEAEPGGPKAQLLLLPGVVATDAEQLAIAAGLEDIARRLLIMAGLAGLGGLVVWRRRRGVLQ